MLRVGKDILYCETSSQNPVTHRVKAGETFEVEAQINAGPWLERLPESEQAFWRKKIARGNPASGCIYVEGAKAGDQLSIEIGPIDLDPIGYTQFSGNNGAMPGWMDIGAQKKVVEIKDGLIHWSESLRLPAKPMLGYLSVAPPDDSHYHNGWGGFWGGNLDAQEIGPGATLHLRVHHDGALLQVGDMHAIQGDGEICGAGGIEAGGRVQLTCRVHGRASPHLRYPRFENATHVGVLGVAVRPEEAFHIALIDLLRWLNETWKLPLGEAYMLLGQVLEARCTAFVNPAFTYVAKVERRCLPRV
jgi:acetamidase/formamidase